MWKILYSKHTDDPIIKEAEKRQINITNASKKKLQTMLEKFPELFDGGLGRINGMELASIKLKQGSKPYANQHHIFPKLYEIPTKK